MKTKALFSFLKKQNISKAYIAAQLGISRQAVNGWRLRKLVPKDCAKELAKLYKDLSCDESLYPSRFE